MNRKELTTSCLVVGAVLLSIFNSARAQEPADIECNPQSICIIKSTLLPLRVLPRVASHVYADKKAEPDSIKFSNIRAFYPLYVYARVDTDFSDPVNPKGWYAVGVTPSGGAMGWMQAKDVLEWRQALVVAFTHPGTGSDRRFDPEHRVCD